MPTFTFEGRAIEAEDGETVLGTLLRHEVTVENGYRVGACQACLLRSSDPVPSKSQQGLDESLIDLGVFMACQADPVAVTSVERVGSEVLPHTRLSWSRSDLPPKTWRF